MIININDHHNNNNNNNNNNNSNNITHNDNDNTTIIININNHDDDNDNNNSYQHCVFRAKVHIAQSLCLKYIFMIWCFNLLSVRFGGRTCLEEL